TKSADPKAGKGTEASKTHPFAGLQQAQLILAAMPPVVRAAGRSAERAYAVVCALLLSKDSTVRKQQDTLILQSLTQSRKQAYADVLPFIEPLPDEQRLPALELAMPALHSLDSGEVETLLSQCRRLIAADNKVSAFEWCLLQMLRRHFKLRNPQSESPHTTITSEDRSAALNLITAVFLLDP
ncbi:hypothetical protein RZS08_09025, partial [Arthrospira platensis SPKY1]|nr:hypothetical protein [Arthrospira platensis SPKY1]